MMRHTAVLCDFRVLAPEYRGDQQRAFDWLASAHAEAEVALRTAQGQSAPEDLRRRMRRLVLRFGSMTDRIQFRGTVLGDFSHQDWSQMRIFSLAAEPGGARCGERTNLYADVVEDAFERFYAGQDSAPDVLMHVTCTGYVAPSGAQLLVSRRRWGARTEVIHAYHMGCYAALPGIRIADSLLASGRQRVDLVHTELCSIHLDPTLHTPEQLMVQSLFADGMARYSLVPAERFARCAPERGPGLQLLATHEEIVPDTLGEMGWRTADHGMRMSLSREVPERIEPWLKPLLERLAEAAQRRPEDLLERAVFAVHPGGPRIIDQVRVALGLHETQVRHSDEVLAQHGNMSSATLPHIWQAILADGAVAPGTDVVSFAFGPGLTLSGAVLRKQGPA
jgi:predicted naringenin-chalcone synthase